MNTLYLREERYFKLLDELSREYRVYLPVKAQGQALACAFGFKAATADYALEKYSVVPKDEIIFNEYRTIDSLKSFFSPPKEKVASDFGSPSGIPGDEKVAVFGVKNCDLFSLRIQDFVFLGGAAVDPFYEKRRRNTLLVSGDCLNFKEVCFCAALDIMPYALDGFDLNMSPLNAGFLVDVGSDKGREVVEKYASYFLPATDTQISARQKKREAMLKKLREHLVLHNIPRKEEIPGIVRKGYDSAIWKERILTCVECGGCNMLCGTCHCFLLSDKKSGNVNEKVRSWDACLYLNFARVAGGANPMKNRYQRLRNRYLKKFDFFPANIDLCACCGCGRCIEVCPGKIDIREILNSLAKEAAAANEYSTG
ncbi:MAG: 4Fe-4S dicluster domain-containing protein [Candidatus Omnitrophica bacterium]|nr:4Fe-4S dicluster domain-containing protein [Candidatus Omnitrophota bacterium]